MAAQKETLRIIPVLEMGYWNPIEESPVTVALQLGSGSIPAEYQGCPAHAVLRAARCMKGMFASFEELKPADAVPWNPDTVLCVPAEHGDPVLCKNTPQDYQKLVAAVRCAQGNPVFISTNPDQEPAVVAEAAQRFIRTWRKALGHIDAAVQDEAPTAWGQITAIQLDMAVESIGTDPLDPAGKDSPPPVWEALPEEYSGLHLAATDISPEEPEKVACAIVAKIVGESEQAVAEWADRRLNAGRRYVHGIDDAEFKRTATWPDGSPGSSGIMVAARTQHAAPHLTRPLACIPAQPTDMLLEAVEAAVHPFVVDRDIPPIIAYDAAAVKDTPVGTVGWNNKVADVALQVPKGAWFWIVYTEIPPRQAPNAPKETADTVAVFPVRGTAAAVGCSNVAQQLDAQERGGSPTFGIGIAQDIQDVLRNQLVILETLKAGAAHG